MSEIFLLINFFFIWSDEPWYPLKKSRGAILTPESRLLVEGRIRGVLSLSQPLLQFALIIQHENVNIFTFDIIIYCFCCISSIFNPVVKAFQYLGSIRISICIIFKFLLFCREWRTSEREKDISKKCVWQCRKMLWGSPHFVLHILRCLCKHCSVSVGANIHSWLQSYIP